MKSFLAFLFFIMLASAHAQKIGLQLYSVRNQIPNNVEATLRQIRAWGITELEGGSTYGMTQQDYNALLKKIGLKTVAIGADFAELEKDPAKVAEKADAFGAKYVMCAWIPHKGVQLTLDEAKNAIRVFENAGKILAAKGVSLCYHMHGFEFDKYENGTLFDYMVTNSNPKYLNFEMDVFWVKQPGQDPVALLKKYPKRFLLMHLKDRKIGTPNSLDGHADVETNVVLGTGDVGIAEIMKNAKGVKYFFIEDESSRVMEQVPQSLAFLKGVKVAEPKISY
jgi:sugar phosphate isomerase/epimerase